MATVNENQQLVDQYVENVSNLDTQKIKTFKKIKNFCSELHQSIDKLESSLKEQIDMEVVRQKSKLKDTIADLQNDDLVLDQTFNEIAVDVALDRSLIQSIQTLGKVQVNVCCTLNPKQLLTFKSYFYPIPLSRKRKKVNYNKLIKKHEL